MKMIFLKNIVALLVFGNIFLVSSIGAKTINVLLITGGHDFEQELFFNVFDNIKGIEYSIIVQPEANQIYNSDSIDKFDAIVFYDMVQDITEQQKESFIQMLNNGMGIIFLHHSLVSYQGWDEFGRIIGGRYYLKAFKRDDDSIPASTYIHNQNIPIIIADKHHPITKGINDFVIHDEAYGNTESFSFVHPLLITNHPENGKTVAWVNYYGKSRIVFLQLGHDHFAWENENFIKIISNSLKWVSKH